MNSPIKFAIYARGLERYVSVSAHFIRTINKSSNQSERTARIGETHPSNKLDNFDYTGGHNQGRQNKENFGSNSAISSAQPNLSLALRPWLAEPVLR